MREPAQRDGQTAQDIGFQFGKILDVHGKPCNKITVRWILYRIKPMVWFAAGSRHSVSAAEIDMEKGCGELHRNTRNDVIARSHYMRRCGIRAHHQSPAFVLA
jgi:hypothetical protein